MYHILRVFAVVSRDHINITAGYILRLLRENPRQDTGELDMWKECHLQYSLSDIFMDDYFLFVWISPLIICSIIYLRCIIMVQIAFKMCVLCQGNAYSCHLKHLISSYKETTQYTDNIVRYERILLFLQDQYNCKQRYMTRHLLIMYQEVIV